MAERVLFKSLVPQLVVPDVVKTAEYYRDILGFKILGYFLDPPVYAMVSRGNIEIHFGKSDSSEIVINDDARRGLGHDLYIFVSDVYELHRELTESGANMLGEPLKREYGSIDFDVLDCDGHRLVFAD